MVQEGDSTRHEDAPGRSRLPWLVFMVVCIVAAIAAAATLVVLLLSDDDEGIPDAIPVIGDDDEDFDRPRVRFVELEDGDVLPLAPQIIRVVAAHPEGVETVSFFIEGDDEVVTANTGGGTDNEVSFPFDPQEEGDYVLVTEATASDGTVSEPVEVEITVEEEEPVAARPQ
jgi:hypothetical protein